MSSTVVSTNTTINKGLTPYYQPFKERYSLEGLVQDIKSHLGESGGISSQDVNEEYLISLAQKYISDPSDWIEYFYNDTSKNYTRNAIENINQKANIVSPPATSHLSVHALLIARVATSRMESWKGLPNSRPCQCPLHNEGLSWSIT